MIKKYDESYFSQERQRMVSEQLVVRGIRDRRVLEVMGKVPRHKFVSSEQQASAYEDFPLPIGSGQTISQPYMVALMSESLSLSGSEKVLEIGTGSGYQTAILAELCKEVYSIERHRPLAEKAEQLLRELGYLNTHIKVADGTLGWPEFSPFDAILVTAAAGEIPQILLSQLQEGGKICIPIGGRFSQVLTVCSKDKSQIKRNELCSCIFVPLIGKFGFSQEDA
jgi:protein-L-isoaspartate(D-aspartate) O-methyltransferase